MDMKLPSNELTSGTPSFDLATRAAAAGAAHHKQKAYEFEGVVF
jgi:hypothetical protein